MTKIPEAANLLADYAKRNGLSQNPLGDPLISTGAGPISFESAVDICGKTPPQGVNAEISKPNVPQIAKDRPLQK